MRFHHAQTPQGAVYIAEGGVYRIEERMAGFGMQVCDILKEGRFAHRTAGHDALPKAQAWCREQSKASTQEQAP